MFLQTTESLHSLGAAVSGGGAECECAVLLNLQFVDPFLFKLANSVDVASDMFPFGKSSTIFCIFSWYVCKCVWIPGICSDFIILRSWATLNRELDVDSSDWMWSSNVRIILSMSFALNPLILEKISCKFCIFHVPVLLVAWLMMDAEKLSISFALRSLNIAFKNEGKSHIKLFRVNTSALIQKHWYQPPVFS